ncbi:hypothetical protein HMPREF0541_00418 [Lacticaseibacillus rhamnosus ATCC 21052]|nr:hypothetical protein HMPREF0541_00418 [Lacticaseibacillus rhamnosus ATCC 21052]
MDTARGSQIIYLAAFFNAQQDSLFLICFLKSFSTNKPVIY